MQFTAIQSRSYTTKGETCNLEKFSNKKPEDLERFNRKFNIAQNPVIPPPGNTMQKINV